MMFTPPLDQDPVELSRLLRNLVAIGVIFAIDAEKFTVRVSVGGNETDWIRWGVQRAGMMPHGGRHPSAKKSCYFLQAEILSKPL
ncbi:hypothetical protein CEQ28_023210 [Hafnia alvei]|nr:hypothetical protein CEQ28_023210 [Hafnia alvei]